MNFVDKIIRQSLLDVTPYESARRLFSMSDSNEIETVWLNANENPTAPDLQYNLSLINRYPDFQPEPLISAYADYCGVAKGQVLATRGADEGIELLIRTFCDRGDSIVINPPTYGMYSISAKTEAVNVKEVPSLADFQLDMNNLLPALKNAKIVFICSPNNPTGQVIKRDDIVSVLESTKNKSLVICDEAYIEFCPEHSVLELMKTYPNLVVLRTLSKAFGLAGLRCGFTIASTEVIAALKKVIAPYPVPAPVGQIATTVLQPDGIRWMKDAVRELNALKNEFMQQCANFSWIKETFPSDTNFVLLKLTESTTAKTVMDKAIAENVLLRDQSKQIKLDNTIRVSIGNKAQMNKVLEIFSKV